MTKRSIAVAKTQGRILQAVLELATEKLTVEIVLADVAQRSGVTVQTILRHFGAAMACLMPPSSSVVPRLLPNAPPRWATLRKQCG